MRSDERDPELESREDLEEARRARRAAADDDRRDARDARAQTRRDRDSFEVWRDRGFSILVPILVGYLTVRDFNGDGQIDPFLLMALIAYGTGTASYLIKRMLDRDGDR